jgi:hypothetical protein
VSSRCQLGRNGGGNGEFRLGIGHDLQVRLDFDFLVLARAALHPYAIFKGYTVRLANEYCAGIASGSAGVMLVKFSIPIIDDEDHKPLT